jgi:hypothetical protein
VTVQRVLSALALIFALAHVPFLAPSLEDIDSVNFALGVRDFDVAAHRPHPPGYPVYIALGKVATAIAGLGVDAPPSVIEAKALALLSLLAGLLAIVCLYGVFACLGDGHAFATGFGGASDRDSDRAPWRSLDVSALAATAVTVSCPLFWYLAVRPMSDLPGLAIALMAQACLLLAWWRQRPGVDGDRRLTAAATAASGRMIVIGAFLSAIAIGVRSQTMWLTVPLLVLVLFDRIGRGVAGALLGAGTMFVAGGLAWGVPLLVASGGPNAYLAALGTQAGEDFTAGEMLYLTRNARAAAFAVTRTFVHPWDAPALAAIVLVLAALGIVYLLLRDRRSLVAVTAIAVPYLVFHLLFQDTSFVRYALPLVPVVALLAVRGVALVSVAAVPAVAAIISIAAVAIASPVLLAYSAAPSPTVRMLSLLKAEARTAPPGALAMHQTFVRPLEAEEVGIEPRLLAPPRLEWLELAKYWKSGRVEPIWFLADPVRSDLALIDPASSRDSTELRWPLVARPAFGGMRPSTVRWYRMPAPGWFAEEGWSLTPEAAGMSRLMGRSPHIEPIVAMVRRRAGAARLLIGGRNLAGPKDPAARFTIAIDGTPFQQWDSAPGFFLQVFEIPAGRLTGEGPLARLTVQSTAASGTAPIPTAIEQFDLQDDHALMWAYDAGWQEAEFSPALGVWRWASDRASLRIIGPAQAVHITLSIESPLRYFDEAPLVRATAGSRELAVTTISATRDWAFDAPADALSASGGMVTIETNRTFVPAETGGGADQRRLGLRVFSIHIASKSLTPSEVSR